MSPERRDRSWYEFEAYLDQDMLWPSADGETRTIAEMVPHHALSSYRILREAGEFAQTEAAHTALGRALLRQATGHPDWVLVSDVIARTPRGHYASSAEIPVSYVYEALEHLRDLEDEREAAAQMQMHPVDRATLVQRHLTRRLKDDQP